MNRKILWTILLSLSLWPSFATGQIVNILDEVDDLPEGYSGAVSLPLQWRTGNPDLFQVSGEVDVGFRKRDRLILFIARGEYGEKEGEKFLSGHFEHLRFRKKKTDRFSWELFLQNSHDEFQRLSIRALAGIGVRLTLARWDEGRFTFGTGYMAEYEELTGSPESSQNDLTTFSNRWSNYIQLNLNLQENLLFSETVFIQPVIEQPDDLRILNDTSLKISAGAFFIRNSFLLTIDTRAPEGVERLQTTLKSRLGFDF
ncbi:MAG: DUF481 domain-containing protein [Nitrospira sp.]|nr:DUF481 domain-containing protein [Candidatus Manganitrophaceae bacterium]HIL35399.1 DUF481 domain-containing protein [Candidatus Manganitrophaceae bacterium]